VVIYYTEKAHVHDEFLTTELKAYGNNSLILHSAAFPFITMIFICNEQMFLITGLSAFQSELSVESACINLWTLVHCLDLYFLFRVLRACMLHNFFHDKHLEMDFELIEDLGFIQKQKFFLSRLASLQALQQERRRRLWEYERPYSEDELDLLSTLEVTNRKLKILQNQCNLYTARTKSKAAQLENLSVEIQSAQKNKKVLEKIQSQNGKLLANYSAQQSSLEQENRQREFVLKVAREQVESSRATSYDFDFQNFL